MCVSEAEDDALQAQSKDDNDADVRKISICGVLYSGQARVKYSCMRTPFEKHSP